MTPRQLVSGSTLQREGCHRPPACLVARAGRPLHEGKVSPASGLFDDTGGTPVTLGFLHAGHGGFKPPGGAGAEGAELAVVFQFDPLEGGEVPLTTCFSEMQGLAAVGQAFAKTFHQKIAGGHWSFRFGRHIPAVCSLATFSTA